MHLSDEDLVLAADGELSGRRKTEVSTHLESCPACRDRMFSRRTTIGDFVRARNHHLNAQLPPAAGPRAVFRSRLAELAREPAPALFTFWRPAVLFLAILAAVIAFQTTVS